MSNTISNPEQLDRISALLDAEIASNEASYAKTKFGSKRLGALITTGAVLIASCGGDNDSSEPTITTDRVTVTTESSEEEATPATVENDVEVNVDVEAEAETETNVVVTNNNSAAEETTSDEAVVVTDEMLQARTMTCGGKYDLGEVNMFDLAYKYDFFNSQEAMGNSIMDITVTNEKYGMGQEAFDLALEKGFFNPVTAENANRYDLTTGNDQKDTFINNLHAQVLLENQTFVNGDCRHSESEVEMQSTDIPYITLEAGQSIEGLVIPADQLEDFLKVMNNQEKFLFLEGEIDGVKFVTIVLFANGCDNPIRIETKKPKPPVVTTPTTSVPGKHTPTTTIPVPETTTTTTEPEHTTTTTTEPEHTTTTTTEPEHTTTTTTEPGRKDPTTTIAATENTSAPNPEEEIGDSGDNGTPPILREDDETPSVIEVINTVPEEDEQKGTEEPEREDEPQPTPTIAPPVTTPQYKEDDGTEEDNNNDFVVVER
jgi:hypothetical protein